MTWLDMFDVSSPCILAVSNLLNSMARHTWHVERDRCDSQLSLLCNLYKLWYITYSLIYWSKHLFIISFDGTNRICLCKIIKTTKLVQASTIACSSSTMLDQHGSIRSSLLAPHAKHVKTWCDEPSGIWAYFKPNVAEVKQQWKIPVHNSICPTNHHTTFSRHILYSLFH